MNTPRALPDSHSPGHILVELAQFAGGRDGDDLAVFQDLGGLLDLDPVVSALNPHDRRACVAKAMFCLLYGPDEDPARALDTAATWIETTTEGRAEPDDPDAVAEGLRHIAEFMRWPA